MTSETDSPVAFSPDLPRFLRSHGWQQVDLLEQVRSTNSFALETAKPWHLVAAHDQTAGRGRMARSWQVPAGASVTLSATMPMPSDSSIWGWVPLFAGAVALQACQYLWPEGEFALKWPNDVLAREVTGPNHGEWSKVSGILCQVVPGPTPLVVVGVGINVSQRREELPVPNATSMRLLGSEVTRDELLVELAWRLQELGHTWNDLAGVTFLQEQVRENCSTIGKEVVVQTADGERVATRAIEIDADGRLVTRVPGGLSEGASKVLSDTVAYSVADIEHVRPVEGKRFDG